MAQLPIKAVTFDLDDTLWEIWPIIERAERRLHDWLSHHHPAVTARYTPLQLRQLCDMIARKRPDIAHDRTELRKAALKMAAERAGLTEFCEHTAFRIFHVARNEVEFFAEVMPVLERLSRRYTLGALSNGNADIKLVGLGELFDFALNAVEVGRPKPEPAMFQAALARLGLEPCQIVHVGDEPHHDVQGAAQAGFRTVWVNRAGREWPGGPRADGEIASLEELEPLLERWESSA